MEEALTALLLGHAPLTGLVGQRVHWLRQPVGDAAFPYVNLQIAGGDRSYHMQGETGLRKTRVQADVWAENYTSSKAVMRAFEDVLSGYSGSILGVKIQGAFMEQPRDLTDETTGAERQLFRLTVDTEISWHLET